MMREPPHFKRSNSSILTTLGELFALAPIYLKGRLWSRLARCLTSDSAGYVQSNLGISERLQFSVPATRADLAYCRPQDNVSERATIALATRLAKASSCFVDVGANYGIFTAAVAVATEERIPILALEADPRLAELLRHNVSRNFGANTCTVLPIAAAAERGRVIFNRNLDDDSSGSITDHFAHKHRLAPIEIDASPLSEVLETNRCIEALVKVDVEGAGAQVWDGLAPEHRRVRWLICEIIAPEVEARLPDAICEMTGWSAYYIRDFNLIKTTLVGFQYIAPFWNWLFTPVPIDEIRALLGHKFQIVDET